jgi:RNA polymerase sigma-70 factor, ECF subfamily
VTTPADPHRPVDDGREELNAVFTAAYAELRRLAAVIQRSDSAATLSPTALVNEAWMKLAASPSVAQASPLHFRRIAARAMRQVLVEAARRRYAEKRGGPDAAFVTLDGDIAAEVTTGGELLSLNAALEELAVMNVRQARVVELRFFAGLEVAETAEALEISQETVYRDWRAARAWLAVRLRDAH